MTIPIPPREVEQALPTNQECKEPTELQQASHIISGLVEKAKKAQELFDAVIARFPNTLQECPQFGTEYIQLGVIRRQLATTQLQLQVIPGDTCKQVLNQQEQYAKTYRRLDNLQKLLPVLVTIKQPY